ncbi:MAG: flagellar basal body L-ring protein FlgH [Thermodesulfovibrionales bacterium]
MKKLLWAALAAMLVSACAGASRMDIPPAPEAYAPPAPVESRPSVNSLWTERGGLYSDLRARGAGDLVTIKIVENASASKKAETATSKDSSLDAGVDDIFGAPLDLNLSNFYGQGHTFSPTVKGSSQSDFAGKGQTTRSGTLAATITARVVDVEPNGNFLIESRKEITVNREKQILVLRGVIRPEDIESDNTILSTYVADAKMFFTGQGVIQDKQGPGWLVRIVDKIWPF